MMLSCGERTVMQMKRILIIEDDAPLSWLLERMLRGKYYVTVMNSGSEAWSWLSDGNKCDLIIADMNVPALSGLELLERLRSGERCHRIAVIMLSGLDDCKEKCFELGVTGFYVKPFDPQLLFSDIKHALEQPAQETVTV